MSLREELDQFWSWSKITPKEYSIDRLSNGSNYNEWETDFPNIDKLYEFSKEEIANLNEKYTKVQLLNLLESIAIDNQCGVIIDYCEKELTNLEELAKEGYKFYQPETRWQIANLLGNTELDSRVQFIENRIQYLEYMAENDDYEYARRRARVNLKKVLEFELEQKKLMNGEIF